MVSIEQRPCFVAKQDNYFQGKGHENLQSSQAKKMRTLGKTSSIGYQIVEASTCEFGGRITCFLENQSATYWGKSAQNLP